MIATSAEQLEQIFAECQILEKDGFGPKVLESKDGLVIYKLFRRKRWFSSALLRPYAIRFVANAKKLEMLGFCTISIREISCCKRPAYHLVAYDKLPGISLRDYLDGLGDKAEAVKDESRAQVFASFGEMIARLHNNGVYFRSLHLGNLLWRECGDFPLIDIADMRFYQRSLTPAQRLRNFHPLLKRTIDHYLVDAASWELMIKSYLEFAAINSQQALRLGPKLTGLAAGLESRKF